jgi:hypothetical protein
MTHRISRAAMAALLAVLAGCGGGDGPTGNGGPTAITATTSLSSTVPVGASAGVFAVKVTDASGSPVADQTVTFTVTNGGTATPASVATNASGVAQSTIAAGTTTGTMTVVASVSTTLSASAVVTVTSAAVGCTTPAIGVAVTFQGVASACLTGAAASTDYTLVAYNSDTVGTQSASITATGVGTPPTATRLSSNDLAASRALVGLSTPTLVPDDAFHMRHLRKSVEMTPRFAAARQWQGARAGLRANRSVVPGDAAAHSAIGANPTIGTVVTLNVNGNQGCSAPINHPVRIMSVGTKAIVMADTLNPSGGFTQADYDQFAASFDTLVYPLDVGNFGAPTDIDGNGRVAIIFTRAVNELTAPNSSSYVGGFFYDRDLFPKTSSTMFACPASNEGEMFYMLAPDPTGIAYEGTDNTTPKSSNIRTTALVKSLTTSTIAHEFQHLINASRKIYVNTTAEGEEIAWLNEGLSHIAEELLYFRQSGRAPRQNLTDANIRLESSANYQIWKDDDAQNFSRFGSYLRAPASSSPRGADDTDDELSTRGAAWSFLRYATDRLYAADTEVWSRLVNSTKTGLGTLRIAYGNDPVGLFRDWTIANYLDDSGVTTDPRYEHLSWNYHDVFSNTFTARVYPLVVTGMAQGVSQSVSVARNSAAYYRLTVPAGGQAQVALTGSGTTPNAKLQFVFIRTR